MLHSTVAPVKFVLFITVQVGEILRKEFNMDAATVEGLDRWERIGVLRELSNQACMSGTANVRPSH